MVRGFRRGGAEDGECDYFTWLLWSQQWRLQEEEVHQHDRRERVIVLCSDSPPRNENVIHPRPLLWVEVRPSTAVVCAAHPLV